MTENKATLIIWEQVQKTDPAYTKKFRRVGGFEGTAIDPLYNIYRATEMFGPVGIGWGYEIIDEQIIEGAPIFDNKRACVGQDKVHEMKIKLWYKHQGEIGSLVSSGATTVVSKNKYGMTTDEEAVKKSLTDAISKGLSWLGFSADVHLGLFDSNKYVEGLKAEYGSQDGSRGSGQGAAQNGSGRKQPQSDELPRVDGVSFEEITGKDGNQYVLAKGDTYNKKSVLDNLGFKKMKDRSGNWVVYRPKQSRAA